MYLLKAPLILFWFGIAPYFVGRLITGRMKKSKNSVLLAALCGYAGMFLLFEIMALPMIFARLPFGVLKYSYGILVILLVIVSVIQNRQGMVQMTSGKQKQGKRLSWTGVLALVLIAVQIGAYVVGTATDLDDAFFVATAGVSIETDAMFLVNPYTGIEVRGLPTRYVLSPFPILLAFFAEAVQIHPTIVAHTVMPVFFVLLAYSVYALLGQKLFKGDVKTTGMFLCFLSLIHMFSYYSVYTQGTFMLIRIWQGKAFLAAVILPFVFYMGMQVFEKEASFGDWIGLLAVMGASCLVSSMGIMLAPIMLGIVAVLLGISKKQWKKTGQALLCCAPNLICAVIYLLIR